MIRRIGWLFIVAAVAAVPIPARAADPTPALVLRVRSLESLAEDARYLAALVGQEENVKGFDAKLRQLPGIDTKKPFGVYATISPGIVDSSLAALVPVTGEKEFLNLLAAFGHQPERDKDGVYTVSVPPVPFPLHFRIANGYAYITVRDKAAIDKEKLLAPAKLFPAGQKELLVLSLRFDQIPEMLKQVLVSQIELQLPNVLEQKQPNETEAQHRVKVALGKELANVVTSLLQDCQEIRLDLNLDRKNHDLGLQFSVRAARNSALAKNLAALGKTTAPYAGLLKGDAALSGGFSITLPEDVRKSLLAVMEEGLRKDLETEQNALKKEVLPRLLKALEPTLRAGLIQNGGALRGPSATGRFSAVGMGHVQDGATLERSLRGIVQDLPANARALIQLDHAKAGPVAIHRINPPKDKLKAEAVKLFGDGPIYAAVTADTIYAAFGENSLEALKQALALKPGLVPVLQVEASISRLVALGEAADQDRVVAVARKVFQGADKDSDRVRVRVEGGEALKVRLEAKTTLLKFFYEVRQARK